MRPPRGFTGSDARHHEEVRRATPTRWSVWRLLREERSERGVRGMVVLWARRCGGFHALQERGPCLRRSLPARGTRTVGGGGHLRALGASWGWSPLISSILATQHTDGVHS